MRGYFMVLVVVALTWIAPLREARAKPITRPTAVLAKFTLGAPSGLDGLKAFADSMQPGVGGMLSASMILKSGMGLPLDGLDASAPLHVLMVADQTDRAIHGFVLVGKVSDAKLVATDAVKKGGWAVVGDPRLSKLAAPWALATLTGPVPPDLIGTFYPDSALAVYGAEFQMVKAMSAQQTGSGMSGQFMTAWWDGFEGFIKDTLAVTLRFDVDANHLGVDLAFAPKAKSRLATFVAAQKPMDLALLGKLAAAPSSILMAGKLSLGPYRDAMVQVMAMFYGQGSNTDIAATFAELMQKTTGDFAAAMNVGPKSGIQMRALYGVADPTGLDATVGKMFATMAKPQTVTMSGVTTTTVAVPGTTTYDGTTIRTYESTTTPATIGNGKIRGSVGVVDKLIVMASDGDMKRTIDVARGKGTALVPTASQQTAFARAAKRQDSLAMTMDFAAFAAMSPTPLKLPAGSELLFSMGFADRSAHVYLGMPAATFRAMMPGAQHPASSPGAQRP